LPETIQTNRATKLNHKNILDSTKERMPKHNIDLPAWQAGCIKTKNEIHRAELKRDYWVIPASCSRIAESNKNGANL